MSVRSDGGGVLGRVGVGGVEGDGGGEGGDVLEDVFGLQEFRINMFWCEETLANDENLCRDVTDMSVADSSNESRRTYRDEGGLVASTVLNNCPKTHINAL